jgi:hypothetical protein
MKAIAADGKEYYYSNHDIHTGVILTMKNGHRYMLDLTSAQFGWNEAVMLESDYKSKRCRRIKLSQPLGASKDIYINTIAPM